MPYISEKRPNKKLVLAGIFVCIFLIVAALTFSFSRFMFKDKLTLKIPMVILLTGVDATDFAKKTQSGSMNSLQSDTFMLTLIDPEKHRVSIISIPKDTLVNVPGYSLDRIGNTGVLGGIGLLRKAVSELTGIPVQRFVVVNMEGLVRLVDLLGGVEIYLPKELIIKDNFGNNITTLAAGKRLLNGERALQYIRFNNTLPEDLNRLERQRDFLFALGRRVKEPKNIGKIPQLVELKQKYIKTDLSGQELMQLLNFTQQIKSGKGFLSVTLPGDLYQGYWQPESLKVDRLIRKIKPTVPQKNGGIKID